MGTGQFGFGEKSSNVKELDTFFNRSGEKPKSFITLLYGDGGSGKTFTGMSFPEPVIYIDTEERATYCKYYNYPDKDVKIYSPISIKPEISDAENALDTYQTIENVTEFVTTLYKEITAGRKVGTVVFDSVTDLWSYIQDWGVYELAKRGKADSTTFRMKDQFDWRVPNKKYMQIMLALRAMTNFGVYVVLTAREDKPPDYVKDRTSKKNLIRAQKDTQFFSDVIFNMRTTNDNGTEKYMAHCGKLVSLAPNNVIVEDLNFNKIIELKERAEKVIQNRKKVDRVEQKTTVEAPSAF